MAGLYNDVPEMKNVPKPKFHKRMPVGIGLDILTGKYYKGQKGENLLNGGCGGLIGVIGPGNSFKSIYVFHCIITTITALSQVTNTSFLTLDTENHLEEARLIHLAKEIAKNLGLEPKTEEDNLVADGTIKLCATSSCSFDDFYNLIVNLTKGMCAGESKYVVEYPFIDENQPDNIHRDIIPTYVSIDSFSEAIPEGIIDKESKKEIADKSNNTNDMTSNKLKTKIVSRISRLSAEINMGASFVGQLKKNIDMDAGNIYKKKPEKILATVSPDESIPGFTNKMTFLAHSMFKNSKSKLLINSVTRSPEYPANKEDNTSESRDQYTVKVVVLRNKHGPSDVTIDLVVSQTNGIRPGLTAYYNLKNNYKKFGIGGSDKVFHMSLYPNQNLTRVTLSSMIDSDYHLKRALEITYELAQLFKYKGNDYPFITLLATPIELYDDIKSMGYDWDLLLETRGYWLPDNYNKKVRPYLSTLDLLEMRKGLYFPYWYPKDKLDIIKKKLKKEPSTTNK